MGAQKGKDLLLKLDFDQNGTFETVAGMRSRRIAFNAEGVDITNADSAGRWRELLEGAGVRRAGVSGAGIFKDAASDASVRELFFDGAVRTGKGVGWDELMGLGLGRMRLSPAAFWAMTPREFSAAVGAVVPARQALGRAAFEALLRRYPDDQRMVRDPSPIPSPQGGGGVL